jgi:hypothetical protein
LTDNEDALALFHLPVDLRFAASPDMMMITTSNKMQPRSIVKPISSIQKKKGAVRVFETLFVLANLKMHRQQERERTTLGKERTLSKKFDGSEDPPFTDTYRLSQVMRAKTLGIKP